MFRHRAATAAAIAIGLVAAGCGSSASSSSGSTAPSTTAAGTASSTTSVAGTSNSTTSVSTSSGSAPSGPGAASTIGITPTAITIGQLADVTGPVPGLFTGAVDGLDAWAAKANAAGGINGRKVVIKHTDSAISCNTYTNGIKSLAGSVFANVGTFSLETACGIPTLKANPDFIDLEAAIIDPNVGSTSNVYAPAAAPAGFYTTGYQYVKGKYGTSAVAKTAALYSAQAITAYKENSAAAESVGYKYVYSRGVGTTETQFTSDILRMKSDGVEVVDMTATNAVDMADFLQQSAQQNFHPDAVISGTAYDSSFFKLLGNSALATNVQLVLPYAMYLGEDATSVPEITAMTNLIHKTHPGDPLNLFALDGYAAGLLFQQAMTAAGSNPTRGSFLTALQHVNQFNANGLLPEGNPGGKVPAACVVMATVSGGKYVRESPPDKGFDCNGTFHPYSG